MQSLICLHYRYLTQKTIWYSLPNLIVFDKINDSYMWAKQNLKFGSENKVTLETKKINKDELKTELKRLDQ